MEGSQAVTAAVAMCRPKVICAYPISPQTHIVEGLSAIVKRGELAPCEFINVESEFAAMSVAIGASATGALPPRRRPGLRQLLTVPGAGRASRRGAGRGGELTRPR
jgi:Pyruvate flavodoxin/ferredoxin oxidoreductase, thiamine diP-bdg